MMLDDDPATQTPLKTCPWAKTKKARSQHEPHEPHVMPLTEPHAGARAMLKPPELMHEPHATLMPQTEPISVPSPQRRPTSRKPRRAPTPPLCKGPAEMMKILTLDGEWRTMGASPLAAAHELLDDGDEPDECAVCGGSLFQPADDDEGPFAMSPPKLSPRTCRCPPARPGG